MSQDKTIENLEIAGVEAVGADASSMGQSSELAQEVALGSDLKNNQQAVAASEKIEISEKEDKEKVKRENLEDENSSTVTVTHVQEAGEEVTQAADFADRQDIEGYSFLEGTSGEDSSLVLGAAEGGLAESLSSAASSIGSAAASAGSAASSVLSTIGLAAIGAIAAVSQLMTMTTE